MLTSRKARGKEVSIPTRRPLTLTGVGIRGRLALVPLTQGLVSPWQPGARVADRHVMYSCCSRSTV